MPGFPTASANLGRSGRPGELRNMLKDNHDARSHPLFGSVCRQTSPPSPRDVGNEPGVVSSGRGL